MPAMTESETKPAVPEPPGAPAPTPAEALSRAWLALPEAQKARFLKQVNERAPKMLENWMIAAGVTGVRRVEAAARKGDAGGRLDALVADLARVRDWAFLFVDWFKHQKTYMNDFCSKVQGELAVAGCAPSDVEPRMLDACRARFKDDPFLDLFVATVIFHNREHEREK